MDDAQSKQAPYHFFLIRWLTCITLEAIYRTYKGDIKTKHYMLPPKSK